MDNNSGKPVNAFLQVKDNQLKNILAKVNRLAELNLKIGEWFEEAIAKYCHVANIEGNRLVLIAANGSIATIIRYQVPELLVAFKQDPLLREITDIQCKVRPHVHVSSRKRRMMESEKMQTLSEDTAEIVSEIAESIQDPKLREIMKKIASHRRES